ncbi:MAG: hypothetical protein JF606_27540 [Burkholderiales bacterium]|jgi:hypothetical protein|nr:hypothetical protein [Burkholderiales bacterium]
MAAWKSFFGAIQSSFFAVLHQNRIAQRRKAINPAWLILNYAGTSSHLWRMQKFRINQAGSIPLQALDDLAQSRCPSSGGSPSI